MSNQFESEQAARAAALNHAKTMTAGQTGFMGGAASMAEKVGSWIAISEYILTGNTPGIVATNDPTIVPDFLVTDAASDRHRTIVEIADRLVEKFGDSEDIFTWLTSGNDDLGGYRPLRLMTEGNFEPVVQALRQ